jgi:hypothetical protein
MCAFGRTGRFACIAVMIALVTVAGGCAARSSSESSGGTQTSLVAPSPGTPQIGSGSSAGQATPDYAGANTPDTAKSGDAAATVAAPADKLVVVTKTLRVETKDVDGALTKIRALAVRDGADITNMQVSTSVDEPVYPTPVDGQASDAEGSSVPLRAFVTVRVPTAAYTGFIADAAKLGRVLFQSETADDVTQQHVDMQARLGNLKSEQARLRQLFTRANSVKDMLSIERELTRVQGDIESMQAQIDYLERQAAMATVTIELTEPVAIVSPAGIDWGVSSAFTDGVRAFVNTMNGLIVLLGPVLALLVFIGLPVWLIVWLVRRMLRNRRAAAPKTSPTPPSAETPDDRAGQAL